MKKAPLTIRHWETGADLREKGWSADTVAWEVKRHGLRNGQCVVYFNNSKMFGGSGGHEPKCRIYGMFNGQAFTMIPPVKKGYEQVDYQHHLNQWIRSTFGGASTDLTKEVFSPYESRRLKWEERRQMLLKARRRKS